MASVGAGRHSALNLVGVRPGKKAPVGCKNGASRFISVSSEFAEVCGKFAEVCEKFAELARARYDYEISATVHQTPHLIILARLLG